MKRILIAILLGFCFVLAGCDYGGAALIQNSDGSFSEVFYVPYAEQSLVNSGVTIDASRMEILPAIKKECDALFVNMINQYQQRIGANDNYTLAEKAMLVGGVEIVSNFPSNIYLYNEYFTEIRYEIYYANSLCYKEFKNINDVLKEDQVIEETNNFFTITKKVVKDPVFDKIAKGSITIGQTCVNLAASIMENSLGTVFWETIKSEIGFDEASSKFDYTYVVPTARIHTNANSVVKSEEGYYFHTWTINLNNAVNEDAIKIEYWTIQANTPVWYVFAIVVAVGIILTTGIIAKRQQKQMQEKFKVEI